MHEKRFIGIGINLTDGMQVTIAAQACLPILHLGMGLLSGWADIVVYPDAFYVHRDQVDEFGVVHQQERLLSGEAWSRGPIVCCHGQILSMRFVIATVATTLSFMKLPTSSIC